MVNTQLFASSRGRMVPAAEVRNEAGGAAYQRSAEAELALCAATGCFNGIFYSDAATQLSQVLAACRRVSPAYVARTALYARRTAYMKDMPALLLAYLAGCDGELLEKVFDRVIDNGRMLRNFVQILRSGVTGRKSLGTRPKRLVQRWLENASVDAVLSAAIGEKPSLADVIRMVHPKPADAERAALYAWLIGRPCDAAKLPAKVRELEAFKQQPGEAVPDLPFQYLTALPLQASHWKAIALRASWQTTRMNLNAFGRHGVFEDAALTQSIVERLRDAEAIRRARVFPYQLMAAFRSVSRDMPPAIAEALQDAMEVATRNVPKVDGNVVVAVDVSGSMGSALTGFRRGATSAVRCVDVAALLAACLKRVNPQTRIIPFAEAVRDCRVNPRDSVMTQAAQLAGLLGGGTAVSAALTELNRQRSEVDLLVLVSDNQSWVDTRTSGGSESMRQWAVLKSRCPQARMVCIDLQPYATSQTVQTQDVLHVGGFSDAVFDLLAGVATEGTETRSWVERIEAMAL
ncbi:vWA domain-containing protein [Dyella mobilis]|uniref:TROVE domain-containing protein n=1 Tax=Dyella mobilis TaxID=1849582 RepID=A0ABS2KG70_9GAMM|nr:TROVE domain-containing protein [Dyella mobilis]MBM7129913.1 TROVE domain-containing protein [Dyella mobilis]GLQ97824.1 ribonucleoprotein [Dyella mobilis]